MIKIFGEKVEGLEANLVTKDLDHKKEIEMHKEVEFKYRSKIASQEREIQEFKQQIETKDKQIDDLNTQLSDLYSANSKLEEKHLSLQQFVDRMDYPQQDNESKIAELQEQLSKIKEENRVLEVNKTQILQKTSIQSKQLEEKLANINSSYELNMEKLNKKKTKISNLKTQHSEKTTQIIDDHAISIKNLQECWQQETQKLIEETCLTQISQLKEQLSDAELKIKEQEGVLEIFKNQSPGLARRLTALNKSFTLKSTSALEVDQGTTNDQLDEIIEEMEVENENLKKEISQLQEECKTHEENQTKAQEDMKEQIIKTEKAEISILNLKKRIEILKETKNSKISKLQEQCDSYNSMNNSLQSLIQSKKIPPEIQAKHDKQIADLNDENDKLTEKYAKLNSEVLMLRLSKKTQGEVIFELKQSLESSRKASDIRAQKKIDEYDSMKKNLDAEVATLKNQLKVREDDDISALAFVNKFQSEFTSLKGSIDCLTSVKKQAPDGNDQEEYQNEITELKELVYQIYSQMNEGQANSQLVDHEAMKLYEKNFKDLQQAVNDLQNGKPVKPNSKAKLAITSHLKKAIEKVEPHVARQTVHGQQIVIKEFRHQTNAEKKVLAASVENRHKVFEYEEKIRILQKNYSDLEALLKQKEANFKKETERLAQKCKVLDAHVASIKNNGSEELESLQKKVEQQKQELQKARTKDVVTVPDVRTEEKLKKTKQKASEQKEQLMENERDIASMKKVIANMKQQIKNNEKKTEQQLFDLKTTHQSEVDELNKILSIRAESITECRNTHGVQLQKYHAKIKALKKEIEDDRHKVITTKVELNTVTKYEDHIIKLNKQVGDLKVKLARNDSKEYDFQRLKDKIKMLKRAPNFNVKSERHHCQNMAQIDHDQKVNRLLEDIENLRKTRALKIIRKSEQELITKQENQIVELQEKVEDLETKVSFYESKEDSAQEIVEHHKSKYENFESHIQSLEEHISVIKENNDQDVAKQFNASIYEEKITELKITITKLNKIIAKQHKQQILQDMEELQKEVAKLKDRIQTLRIEIMHLQKNHVTETLELQQEISSQQQTIGALKAQIEDLLARIPACDQSTQTNDVMLKSTDAGQTTIKFYEEMGSQIEAPMRNNTTQVELVMQDMAVQNVAILSEQTCQTFQQTHEKGSQFEVYSTSVITQTGAQYKTDQNFQIEPDVNDQFTQTKSERFSEEQKLIEQQKKEIDQLKRKLSKVDDEKDLLQRRQKTLTKEIEGNETKMQLLSQKAKIAEQLQNEANQNAENAKRQNKTQRAMKNWLLPRLNRKIEEMANRINIYEAAEAKKKEVRSVWSATEYTTMSWEGFSEDRSRILDVVDGYHFEKAVLLDNIKQQEADIKKYKDMELTGPVKLKEKQDVIDEQRQKISELKNDLFQLKRQTQIDKMEVEEKAKSKGKMLKLIISGLNKKLQEQAEALNIPDNILEVKKEVQNKQSNIVHDYSLEIQRLIRDKVELQAQLDSYEANDHTYIQKKTERYIIQIENLKSAIAKIQQEPNNDQSKINNLKKQISALQTELHAKRSELGETRYKVQALQKKIENQDEEMDELIRQKKPVSEFSKHDFELEKTQLTKQYEAKIAALETRITDTAKLKQQLAALEKEKGDSWVKKVEVEKIVHKIEEVEKIVEKEVIVVKEVIKEVEKKQKPKVIYKDKIIKEIVEVPVEKLVKQVVEKVVYKDRVVTKVVKEPVEVEVEKIVFRDVPQVVTGAGAPPTIIQTYVKEMKSLYKVINKLSKKNKNSAVMQQITSLTQLVEQIQYKMDQQQQQGKNSMFEKYIEQMNTLNHKIYEISKSMEAKKMGIKSVDDNSSNKSKVEPHEHLINIQVQESVLEPNADLEVQSAEAKQA